jgi:hypothetical protein
MDATVDDQDSRRIALIKACRAVESDNVDYSGFITPPVQDTDSIRVATIKLYKALEGG